MTMGMMEFYNFLKQIKAKKVYQVKIENKQNLFLY